MPLGIAAVYGYFEEGAEVETCPLKPAPPGLLVDLARLERAYYQTQPDISDPTQRVAFGTSGHRGSAFKGTFTEEHVLAITQGICESSTVKQETRKPTTAERKGVEAAT